MNLALHVYHCSDRRSRTELTAFILILFLTAMEIKGTNAQDANKSLIVKKRGVTRLNAKYSTAFDETPKNECDQLQVIVKDKVPSISEILNGHSSVNQTFSREGVRVRSKRGEPKNFNHEKSYILSSNKELIGGNKTDYQEAAKKTGTVSIHFTSCPTSNETEDYVGFNRSTFKNLDSGQVIDQLKKHRNEISTETHININKSGFKRASANFGDNRSLNLRNKIKRDTLNGNTLDKHHGLGGKSKSKENKRRFEPIVNIISDGKIRGVPIQSDSTFNDSALRPLNVSFEKFHKSNIFNLETVKINYSLVNKLILDSDSKRIFKEEKNFKNRKEPGTALNKERMQPGVSAVLPVQHETNTTNNDFTSAPSQPEKDLSHGKIVPKLLKNIDITKKRYILDSKNVEIPESTVLYEHIPFNKISFKPATSPSIGSYSCANIKNLTGCYKRISISHNDAQLVHIDINKREQSSSCKSVANPESETLDGHMTLKRFQVPVSILVKPQPPVGLYRLTAINDFAGGFKRISNSKATKSIQSVDNKKKEHDLWCQNRTTSEPKNLDQDVIINKTTLVTTTMEPSSHSPINDLGRRDLKNNASENDTKSFQSLVLKRQKINIINISITIQNPNNWDGHISLNETVNSVTVKSGTSPSIGTTINYLVGGYQRIHISEDAPKLFGIIDIKKKKNIASVNITTEDSKLLDQNTGRNNSFTYIATTLKPRTVNRYRSTTVIDLEKEDKWIPSIDNVQKKNINNKKYINDLSIKTLAALESKNAEHIITNAKKNIITTEEPGTSQPGVLYTPSTNNYFNGENMTNNVGENYTITVTINRNKNKQYDLGNNNKVKIPESKGVGGQIAINKTSINIIITQTPETSQTEDSYTPYVTTNVKYTISVPINRTKNNQYDLDNNITNRESKDVDGHKPTNKTYVNSNKQSDLDDKITILEIIHIDEAIAINKTYINITTTITPGTSQTQGLYTPYVTTNVNYTIPVPLNRNKNKQYDLENITIRKSIGVHGHLTVNKTYINITTTKKPGTTKTEGSYTPYVTTNVEYTIFIPINKNKQNDLNNNNVTIPETKHVDRPIAINKTSINITTTQKPEITNTEGSYIPPITNDMKYTIPIPINRNTNRKYDLGNDNVTIPETKHGDGHKPTNKTSVNITTTQKPEITKTEGLYIPPITYDMKYTIPIQINQNKHKKYDLGNDNVTIPETKHGDGHKPTNKTSVNITTTQKPEITKTEGLYIPPITYDMKYTIPIQINQNKHKKYDLGNDNVTIPETKHGDGHKPTNKTSINISTTQKSGTSQTEGSYTSDVTTNVNYTTSVPIRQNKNNQYALDDNKVTILETKYVDQLIVINKTSINIATTEMPGTSQTEGSYTPSIINSVNYTISILSKENKSQEYYFGNKITNNSKDVDGHKLTNKTSINVITTEKIETSKPGDPFISITTEDLNVEDVQDCIIRNCTITSVSCIINRIKAIALNSTKLNGYMTINKTQITDVTTDNPVSPSPVNSQSLTTTEKLKVYKTEPVTDDYGLSAEEKHWPAVILHRKCFNSYFPPKSAKCNRINEKYLKEEIRSTTNHVYDSPQLVQPLKDNIQRPKKPPGILKNTDCPRNVNRLVAKKVGAVGSLPPCKTLRRGLSTEEPNEIVFLAAMPVNRNKFS